MADKADIFLTAQPNYKLHWMALIIVLAVSAFPGTTFAGNDKPMADLIRSLASLPDNNAVLEVPAGVYKVDGTWEITKPGLTIRGAGIGKTVFVKDADFTGPLVKMNADQSTITNLTLDGHGMDSVIGLKASGVVADTIEVKHFRHIGIAVPGTDCRVTNCAITGFGDPDIRSIGIWHDAGPGAANSSITIDHNVITENGINGVFCTGGRITISGNRFSGNHHQIEPVAGGQICVGNNGRAASTVAMITGNTVVDGGGMKTSGIETAGGSYTITNNTIRNHGMAGIVIGRNANRAVVSGNVISDCGQNVNDRNRPQVRAAIYVLYGAENVAITQNRCFDDQIHKTQTWGVLFVPPSPRVHAQFPFRTTDNIVITGNDLRGNIYPQGLLDQSGARDRTISGNQPAAANR